ncbi:MAG: hypothetical protein E7L06_08235 [Schaalia turicensis]|nr:hypothetical protein [Schaalia turicensis]
MGWTDWVTLIAAVLAAVFGGWSLKLELERRKLDRRLSLVIDASAAYALDGETPDGGARLVRVSFGSQVRVWFAELFHAELEPKVVPELGNAGLPRGNLAPGQVWTMAASSDAWDDAWLVFGVVPSSSSRAVVIWEPLMESSALQARPPGNAFDRWRRRTFGWTPRNALVGPGHEAAIAVKRSRRLQAELERLLQGAQGIAAAQLQEKD